MKLRSSNEFDIIYWCDTLARNFFSNDTVQHCHDIGFILISRMPCNSPKISKYHGTSG